MSKEQFSFNKGWLQLRQGDIAACRKELMVVFNVTTRAAFLHRLKGNVIPNVLEAHNVEKVFAKYGIKDVWGLDYGCRETYQTRIRNCGIVRMGRKQERNCKSPVYFGTNR